MTSQLTVWPLVDVHGDLLVAWTLDRMLGSLSSRVV
jgi:hypothetical protein